MANVARRLFVGLTLLLDGMAFAIGLDRTLGQEMMRIFPVLLPTVNIAALAWVLIERKQAVEALEGLIEAISAEKHAHRLTIAELEKQLADRPPSD